MPKGQEVESMFGRIAGRYDLANRVLSGGVDLLWRRRLVREVRQLKPERLVDLATGSGDVAFALHKGLKPAPEIVGLDFCQPMLDQAILKKPRLLQEGDDIEFIQGDILKLPFPDDQFDAATIAFGYRNLEDRMHGLAEIKRILRPGGSLLILEFTQPYRWFRGIYFFYLKRILPHLARWFTGDKEAYHYLAGSIEAFPSKEETRDTLIEAGFSDVKIIPMTLAIVAIHIARKPVE